MDASYITAFIESIRNVFATMLSAPVSVHKPTVQHDAKSNYDVSGVIGMSGDVTGAVVLSFDIATAEKAVSTFSGIEMTVDHEDFADAIGELVNMVAGGAKVHFTDKQVSISCPSVVVGPNHRIFQQKDMPLIELPCDCDFGPFATYVCLKETAGQEPKPAGHAVAVG